MSNKASIDKATVQKVEKLRKELRRHDYLYYVVGEPKITDEQYDAMMRELQAIEAEYPALITPDSPTQRVGGEPTKEFPIATHSPPMLSLANAYSEEEIQDFDRRVQSLLGNQHYNYVCELKFDGVSLSLRYSNGILTLGATRGDGTQGDDITSNAKTIRSIPLRLETTDKALLNCTIRGEVIMFKKDFEKILPTFGANSSILGVIGINAAVGLGNSSLGRLSLHDNCVGAEDVAMMSPY